MQTQAFSAASFVTAAQAADLLAKHTASTATTTPKPARKRTAKQAPAVVTPAPVASKRGGKAASAAKPVVVPVVHDNAARVVAANAVAAYYSGTSLPFKAASDRFADLRLDKAAKRPSQRQAALFAVMLAADTGGNIKRDGTFTRGGFKLPRSLFDANAKPGETVTCQPETGCLSDALGRTVEYVSGPTSGKQQAETVLRLNLKRARVEISEQIGGALAKAALARLEALGCGEPKAAKRQARA